MYILGNETNNRTYVGYTSNLRRRLRQHNGQLKGGARSTRGCHTWFIHAFVPHLTKAEALSFEARLHKTRWPKPSRSLTTLQKRVAKVYWLIENFPQYHEFVLHNGESQEEFYE